MGNTPPQHELTEDNFKSQKREVLRLSGLPDDQIQTIDVLVGEFKGEPVYMHTVLVGDDTKPPLVFVHGYGHSGALFYKIFKQLSEEFYLILPDMIGMGCSSRPEDFDTPNITPSESISYFVDYLEKWRVAMNNLTGFYLAGHSLGGYISSNYAVAYPQHIKKLQLLSPIGVKITPEGYDNAAYDKLFEGKKRGPSWFSRLVHKLAFPYRISPFAINRFLGHSSTIEFLSKTNYSKSNIQEPARLSKVTNLMYQIQGRPGWRTGEAGGMVLFKTGFMPFISLSFTDKLGNPDLPFAFSIMFGDRDWVRETVDIGDSELLLQKSKFQESKLYVIPTSDHNLHFENPIALANCMINDFFQGSRDLPVLPGPEIRSKYPELIKEIDGEVHYRDEKPTRN